MAGDEIPDGAREAAGDSPMESGRAAGSPQDATGGGPGAGPDADAPLCDLCGERMLEHHCKLVCPQCGYTRDCSDP